MFLNPGMMLLTVLNCLTEKLFQFDKRYGHASIRRSVQCIICEFCTAPKPPSDEGGGKNGVFDGGRETRCMQIYRPCWQSSLPQSASLTAPSSEGAERVKKVFLTRSQTKPTSLGFRLKRLRLAAAHSLCACGVQFARLRAERYFRRRTCHRRK